MPITKFFRLILIIILVFLTTNGCGSNSKHHSKYEPINNVTAVFFDDFNYTSTAELENFNWRIRWTREDAPYVYLPSNVSFITDPVNPQNKLLRLIATTTGPAGSTSQAEICHQQKYFTGTYAARVRFNDAPVTGPDGDAICQTFFTVSLDNDPDYSECDFEYLPNGGWDFAQATMLNTTWETYIPVTNTRDNTKDPTSQSYDGWHDLLLVVSDGTVRYYVDGELLTQHGGKYYPETLMHIVFNIWFIDKLENSNLRTYVQDVDWVYYEKDRVLTTDEAVTKVQNLRNKSIKRKDTVSL